MTQLTALDAQFLNAESGTTAAHVAGVAILDADVTREALAALLAERVHLSPALSQRLTGLPFGLDHPHWAPDPGFDLDNHLFEVRLSHKEELPDAVARIHARHLDRAHPLWEMHLIRGERTAVYVKVHHAAIDGVSGAEALATLLDLTPEPRAVEPAQPAAKGPNHTEMLTDAIKSAATQPMRTLRSLAKAAGDLDAIPVASKLPGARTIARLSRLAMGDRRPRPDLPPMDVPPTPFNGPITAERHVAFGSIPLKDVKQVAKAHGVSVNDVVMTLCAAALRAWLDERGALPDLPLIAAVPVSIRTAGSEDDARNQISAMITPMPTNVADPLERLQTMGASMNTAKRRFAVSSSSWLHELCAMLPAPLSSLATPAVFRLAALAFPPINLIVSNVPGPQFPLYLCGARVLSYYPLSVLTDVSGGVVITCFSYDGALDFGLVACPKRMDDVAKLMARLHDAIDELTQS